MAINFKKFKEKLETTPINEREYRLIDELENYIDKKIVEEYDKTIYQEISIDMSYVNFNYSPVTKTQIENLGLSRIPMMRTELEKRYYKAGWIISYRSDDGIHGGDYMVLKGKVKK